MIVSVEALIYCGSVFECAHGIVRQAFPTLRGSMLTFGFRRLNARDWLWFRSQDVEIKSIHLRALNSYSPTSAVLPQFAVSTEASQVVSSPGISYPDAR